MTTLVIAPSRHCQCGKLLQARTGPGRKALYCSIACRRTAEATKARTAGRQRPADPRAARETLDVRIVDPAKLARGWFRWRYPAWYPTSGDGRRPSGLRTVLTPWPGQVRQIEPGFTVREIPGAVIECHELARWIKSLPGYQQADFASRAIESRISQHMLEQSPDRPVSHGAAVDHREDPVILGQLKAFYKRGECLEGGCHREPEHRGFCRIHYQRFSRLCQVGELLRSRLVT
jgi:hypothetical protein